MPKALVEYAQAATKNIAIQNSDASKPTTYQTQQKKSMPVSTRRVSMTKLSV
jgi:hypothetical protein